MTYSDYGIDAAVNGDFNNDGVLDLALAEGRVCQDYAASGMIVYGNGDGTFVAGPNGIDGGQPVSVVAADFYGTGTPIPVFANFCSIHGCPGGSIFIPGSQNQADIMLLFLAVGDFNNDGKPDLAGSLQFGQEATGASVLLNIGATAAATTTTISSSAPQSCSECQSVTLAAQVHHTGPQTPAGKVEFLDSGVMIGSTLVDSNGQASLTTTGLAVGSHFVVAYYRGDSNFAPSNSLGARITINQANTITKVASSRNPSQYGQNVTFTATVTGRCVGRPTGNVTFYDGTSPLASVPLNNGAATFSTSKLITGDYSMTASYAGDGTFGASISPVVTQVVKQGLAMVTLGSSQNPSYVNQTVAFTAVVKGVNGLVPTGQVDFKQGVLLLATVPLVNGNAVYSTAFGTQGTKSITAVYSGDVNYLRKTSTVLKQVVNRYASNASVASSLNPSVYGQAVNLTSHVTSGAPTQPTGTVTFKNGLSSLGTVPLVNGFALLTKKNLPAGTLSITATYNGDALNNKSTSPTLSQFVRQATTTTTVTSSPNPSVVGQAVKFTFTVKSPTVVPVGTVTFTAGTTTLSQVSLAGGKASLITSAVPKGTTTVTATYNGTSNIIGSSGSVVQTVK